MKRVYYMKKGILFPILSIVCAALFVLMSFGRFYSTSWNNHLPTFFTYFGIDNSFNGFQNFEYLVLGIIPSILLLVFCTLFSKFDPRLNVIPLAVLILVNILGIGAIGEEKYLLPSIFVNIYLNVGNYIVIVTFILLLVAYILTILDVFKNKIIFVIISSCLLLFCSVLMFTGSLFGVKSTFLLIIGSDTTVYWSKFLEVLLTIGCYIFYVLSLTKNPKEVDIDNVSLK
ncbi:MAG: hypothetical protein HUJ61_06190 [Bacilli bacterium]|nr:hypothetical protein [Bacilli bacterium]